LILLMYSAFSLLFPCLVLLLRFTCFNAHKGNIKGTSASVIRIVFFVVCPVCWQSNGPFMLTL